MSPEVVEALELVITQMRETMKAAEENSKELGEAVRKDGFCL